MPTHPHRPGEPESNRPPTGRRDRGVASVSRAARRGSPRRPSGPARRSRARDGRDPTSVARRRSGVPSRAGGACLSSTSRSPGTPRPWRSSRRSTRSFCSSPPRCCSLSFVLVTGFRSLLGAGPAIFLTASALAAVAGRARDGPLRTRPGDRRRLPPRLDRLQPRRRWDALGLGSRADHGVRARRASPER